MAKKPKRIKVAAGSGGSKVRMPPRSKPSNVKRDKSGRFA